MKLAVQLAVGPRAIQPVELGTRGVQEVLAFGLCALETDAVCVEADRALKDLINLVTDAAHHFVVSEQPDAGLMRLEVVGWLSDDLFDFAILQQARVHQAELQVGTRRAEQTLIARLVFLGRQLSRRHVAVIVGRKRRVCYQRFRC